MNGWKHALGCLAIGCAIGFFSWHAGLKMLPLQASMTESEQFVAENFNVYRTGEGTVLADPIYPSEDSEMGVAVVRYRLVSPELYDFQDRPVPVLRQDNLKKDDEVKVESFHNPKAWRQEHVILARPAKK